MDKLSYFNMGDFKKWIKQDPDSLEMKRPSPKGLVVESKVARKVLIRHMTTEDGTAKEMARDFVENGGTISDIDSTNFLIEVDTGSFFVPRRYVRRA